MACVDDDFFYLTRAAKIGRAARPLELYDKAGPTHAFVGRWGEGRACVLEEFVSHTRPYSNASVGRASG